MVDMVKYKYNSWIMITEHSRKVPVNDDFLTIHFYHPNHFSTKCVAESFNSWSTRPKGTGLTSISSRSGKKWFNFQWISQPSLWLNLALKDPKEAIRLNETTSHLSYLYPTPFSKVDIRFSMDKNFFMEVIIGISLIQFL